MDSAKQKEDIQISFISALCASAGIDYETQRHDEDSTDGIIKKRIILGKNSFYDSQLRIQLKCTSSTSQYTYDKDVIMYKLKAKNYNDLCTPSTTPIILGLLILPEDESKWVTWNREELLIKGCMYWADFSNCEKTDNTSTISVRIPKKNYLSQNTLNEILEKISKEEWP